MTSISFVKQLDHNWLPLRRGRRALRHAMRRAYASFANQYPEWAAAYFDQHFLSRRVVPLLSQAGRPYGFPQPSVVAGAWVDQLAIPDEHKRQQLIAEATPVASDFLRMLRTELNE
jgi:hypothetical protein